METTQRKTFHPGIVPLSLLVCIFHKGYATKCSEYCIRNVPGLSTHIPRWVNKDVSHGNDMSFVSFSLTRQYHLFLVLRRHLLLFQATDFEDNFSWGFQRGRQSHGSTPSIRIALKKKYHESNRCKRYVCSLPTYLAFSYNVSSKG